MSQTPDKNAPMDPNATENATPVPVTNNARPCYAAKTLVAEVNEAFPETPYEYSNYNGRNTALDVTFDLSSLDPTDAADLTLVLSLLHGADPRVGPVVVADGSDEQAVLVTFRNVPLIYDTLDPFNIADALAVMDEPVEFMGGSL